MHNLFLEISYLGTNYSGSQSQKNSITIQDLLNKSLLKLFRQDNCRTIFSGRTDAGVHAYNQAVNVLVNKRINEKNIKRALNSFLPHDIRINRITYKPLDFNARYSARSREYIYNIFLGEDLPLYLKDRVWHLKKNKINVQHMKKAAAFLKGKKNFSSFCAAHGNNTNMIRNVIDSKIKISKINNWIGARRYVGRIITYQVKANSFLYHMVRNITAALVDIGLGKIKLIEFKKMMEAKSRRELRIKTAPPEGLILYKVNY